MFDLIVNGHRRTPHRDTAPMMVSLVFHSVVTVTLIVIPLVALDALPPVPTVMKAFVVPVVPPPPPPPPPRPATSTPVPITNPAAAPLVAPKEIVPESPADLRAEASEVEGLVGGFVALPSAPIETAAPPPPPPPPSAPAEPVRVGLDIKPPPQTRRVSPVYPEPAIRSHVEGVVVLDLIVGPEGSVEDVAIVSSIPLLDAAAIEAVRKWRYVPLVLNGQFARFVVTVSVTFRLS